MDYKLYNKIRHGRTLNIKEMSLLLSSNRMIDTLRSIFLSLFLSFAFCFTAHYFALELNEKKNFISIKGSLILYGIIFLVAFIIDLIFYIKCKNSVKRVKKRKIQCSKKALLYYENELNSDYTLKFAFGVLFLVASLLVSAIIFLDNDKALFPVLLIVSFITMFFGLVLTSTKHYMGRIEKLNIKSTDSEDDDFNEKKLRVKNGCLYALFYIFTFVAYFVVSKYFGNFLYFIYFPIAMVTLSIGWIFVNNPFSKYGAYKGLNSTIVIGKTVISIVLIVVLIFLGLNTSTDLNEKYIKTLSYDCFTKKENTITMEKDNSFTIKMSGDEFRILQISDMHICSSITTSYADTKAIDAVYTTIKESNPDLIVVTGDITYALPFQTMTNDNYTPLVQFTKLMNNIGIPWTFTYGNHDTEEVGKYDAEYLNDMFEENSFKNGYPLLFTKDMPAIDGRYNNYIKILNCDGSINKVLFLIDSNDYVKDSVKINDYDTIHSNQIEWYEKTIKSVSKGDTLAQSFLFFHVPLKEFETAYNLYVSGSKAVTYLFGKNGEGTSYSLLENNLFEVAQRCNCKAMFVGHDHLNNIALKYKGIDLVYCRTSDYVAYPKIDEKIDLRGGVNIDLKKDNTYKMSQYCYD